MKITANKSLENSQNHFQVINADAYGSTRTETLEGVSYFVMPMVMIVEGVMNGSTGPVLYTAAELQKAPWTWNGRPVCVNHPVAIVNGQEVYISANNVNSQEKTNIGVIYNAECGVKPDGRVTLKAEAWINLSKCKKLGYNKSVVKPLTAENPQIMECSTGMYEDHAISSGVHNGKSYSAIAMNIIPDHLALLPNDTGACSVEDGCGVLRNNCEGECECGGNCQIETETNKESEDMNKNATMVTKLLAAIGLKNGLTEAEVNQITANELSADDMREQLRTLVRTQYKTDGIYTYIVDVLPQTSRFVWEMYGNGNAKYYLQSFVVSNDIISLVENKVEVVKQTVYTPVSMASNLANSATINDDGGAETETKPTKDTKMNDTQKPNADGTFNISQAEMDEYNALKSANTARIDELRKSVIANNSNLTVEDVAAISDVNLLEKLAKPVGNAETETEKGKENTANSDSDAGNEGDSNSSEGDSNDSTGSNDSTESTASDSTESTANKTTDYSGRTGGSQNENDKGVSQAPSVFTRKPEEIKDSK